MRGHRGEEGKETRDGGVRFFGTMKAKALDVRGQMTVEFAAMLPVILIIAVIATNALLFFSECAAFDRTARNAVRVYATSPTYGQTTEQIRACIEGSLSDAFQADFERASVAVEGRSSDLTCYTATLDYAPNLFGMGLRDSVFGVSLPHLSHQTSLTVDTYTPGMMF